MPRRSLTVWVLGVFFHSFSAAVNCESGGPREEAGNSRKFPRIQSVTKTSACGSAFSSFAMPC
jgi:hypothetical protein